MALLKNLDAYLDAVQAHIVACKRHQAIVLEKDTGIIWWHDSVWKTLQDMLYTYTVVERLAGVEHGEGTQE